MKKMKKQIFNIFSKTLESLKNTQVFFDFFTARETRFWYFNMKEDFEKKNDRTCRGRRIFASVNRPGTQCSRKFDVRPDRMQRRYAASQSDKLSGFQFDRRVWSNEANRVWHVATIA